LKKNLALLFKEDYLGVYPSLINSIKIFCRTNYKTTIVGFSYKSQFPNTPKFDNNLKYFLKEKDIIIDRDYLLEKNSKSNTSCSKWFSLNSCIKILNRIPILSLIFDNIQSYKEQLLEFYDIYDFFSHLKDFFKHNKTDLVIAVDSLTLISAYLHKIIYRKNYLIVFWSLEISSFRSNKLLHRILHRLELKSLLIIDIFLSQSQERGLEVLRPHKIKLSNLLFYSIPHSRCSLNTGHVRYYYFNEKFSITKTDIILLHLGWIHDVMDSYQLTQSTLNWTMNHHLVMHERAKRTINEPYINKINNLGSNKLSLSLSPVDYNSLNNIINSCDIGLVIYKPQGYGYSWHNIAKASGKLADYLAFGKPVICSDLPDLTTLIHKYNCGLVFHSYEEIPDLVCKIMSNYQYYSKNSFDCFNKEFDFEIFFDPFLKGLKSVTHKSNSELV